MKPDPDEIPLLFELKRLKNIHELVQAYIDYYNDNDFKPYDLRLLEIRGFEDNQDDSTSITSVSNIIGENEDLSEIANNTFPNPNRHLDSLKDTFVSHHLDEIKRFVGWLEDKKSSLVHIKIALDEIESSVCKLQEVILLGEEVL